ncbi:peptidase [Pseudoalteromonas phenolica]|uniref:Peptidase n=1 Tax=Pseudoalteromonas phenolica TaxID=161398 RepID=A0A5R9Q4G3_9GAMM|nr:prolyl oligopeptidase family serine peptidase [Pseudoalteromonas phenolica]TLX48051.1 peptidase [Pseudoalteromonas phenolica]
MLKPLILTAALFSSISALAASTINNQQVEQQKSCFSGRFETYGIWRGMIENKIKRRVTEPQKIAQRMKVFDDRFGEEQFNAFKDKLDCTNFKYKVDGNDVWGYVIKPKGSVQLLPTLIYNRGGNGNFGSVVFGAMMANLFPIAEQGFVIIGSQYRGTFSKDDNLDQFGGEDVNDVLALLDLIPHLNGADTNRIGMFGASRGGMQTHLAAKQTSKIKAIATIAGSADLKTGLEIRANMEKVYKNRIPNYAQNKDHELAKRSVLNWVDTMPKDRPILLIHGEKDKRVSATHSENLAAALKKHKVPHKLVLYPEDNHFLERSKSQADAEIVSWFKAHL